MGTEELKPFLEALVEIENYLNERGYTLAIIKKPRKFAYAGMYDEETVLITDKTRFGATNVKERRKEAGLTVSELAKELGVDRHIVMRMEDDRRTHTYKSMKRFADYFECEIEDLLMRDGDADE